VITDESPNVVQDWQQDEVSMNDMENFVLDASRGLAQITKVTDSTVQLDQDRPQIILSWDDLISSSREIPEPEMFMGGASGAYLTEELTHDSHVYYTVQLIHESVREYLLDTWMPSPFGQSVSVLTALSHDRLNHCCRQYVLRSSPSIEREAETLTGTDLGTDVFRARVRQTYPFLDYAMKGMISHADKSLSFGQQSHDFIQALDTWMRLQKIAVEFSPTQYARQNSPV